MEASGSSEDWDLLQNIAELERVQSMHCADAHADGLIPFQRFESLARGVFNAPKAEVDAAETQWQAEQTLREKRPARRARH